MLNTHSVPHTEEIRMSRQASCAQGTFRLVGNQQYVGNCSKAMEKEMAIHSSTLAWKIQWTEEPGRL